MGDSHDFLEGADVAVQEKLQGMAGIELGEEIAGIGQDEDKAVKGAEGEAIFHPVHLGLFSRQKLQFMELAGLSFPEGSGVEFDRVVTSGESIRF
jgi:hypothetical protein